MKNATKTTIDSSGRLVVPKAIRQEAGFLPGMDLQVSCRDGRVELEPAPRKVRIVKKGKVFVALPEDPSEPLTAEVVRRTQEAVRERHAKK